MKVLEADSLLAGIDETSNQLSILKDQVSQVQVSIQELVSLEDAFKGQGGQAIRAYYQECHLPFLQFLESWIDEYQSYLKIFIGSLRDLEPSPSGFIRQEFLEYELKQGLRNTLQITADLTQEANNIMKSVSDIVTLPPLEDGRFIQATKSAEDSSRETFEKLEDFDHRETATLDPLLQDLSLINQYIQKMAGMFQSGSLSLAQYQPKSFNWKDFHEEISNPNSESEPSILQDIAEGAIEGASKAVGDTWDGLKSTYELGRTIMGPFSPLYLGSELLFNREQLLENQRKHQEFYLDIINDPIGKVRQALDMPKYIWLAVTSAWERDVVNGDAKSRTAFFTYGLTSLGIGILGDKGIGKAGTIAKAIGQAGKGEKVLPIYTPVQTPAMAGGGLAQGPVPYNVLHDPLTKIKTVTDNVFGAKGTGNALDGVRIINKKYAGEVYKLSGNLGKKYPEGVKFSEEGFPDFSPYSKANLEIEGLIGDHYYDFKKANEALGLKNTPAGYTWHHVEDGKTMMLVPSDIHGEVRHTGGASLIRKGLRP